MPPNDVIESQLSSLAPARRLEILKAAAGRKSAAGEAPVALNLPQAPLSFAQGGLWLTAQVGGEQHRFNMVSAYSLVGKVRPELLEHAFRRVIDRHRTLKSRFVVRNNEPFQEEIRDVQFQMPVVDLSTESASRREDLLQERLTTESRWQFDLAVGPLFRAHLYRLEEERHVLQINVHHAIFDGWSKVVMFEELSAAYAALLEGTEPKLPALPLQYADFAAWQRKYLREKLDAQVEYWRHALSDAPPLLYLPTDRSRPARQSSEGAVIHTTFDRATVEALRALSRKSGATIFMTLLAAFKLALFRFTGQADICVATPVDNRNRNELKRLIGYFLNTVVLRTRLDGAMSFRELVAEVKRTTLEAFRHQDVPFEQVVEAVSPVRCPSFTPLHQVAFVFQHASSGAPELAGLQTEKLSGGNDTTKYDLYATFREDDDGIHGWIMYRTDLFRAQTVESFADTLQAIVRGVIESPECSLASSPVTSETEQARLVELSRGADLPPLHTSLHDAFFAKAAQNPDRTAIVEDDRRITYGELAQRVRKIAGAFSKLGVGPGARVAVNLPRGISYAESLLAAWTVGAAVVPLDPILPDTRLAVVVESAQPALVVSDGAAARFAPHVRSVAPAEIAQLAVGEGEQSSPVAVSDDFPAFVLFTSGSTGTPKGVVGTHRGMLNRIAWQWGELPPLPNESVAQRTNIGFVDSQTELCATLLSGASLVVIDDRTLRDPFELIDTMARNEVTTLYIVPSLLRVLFDAIPRLHEHLPSLQRVTLSGEALPADLVTRFAEALPDAVFLNVYGATEAADVSAASYSALTAAGERVPIGWPLTGMSLYVLDDELQLCPTGVEGSLYAAGAGVALGYWKNPRLTAERFLPDPHARTAGARMYFLGDRGRRLQDGCVEYRGRGDQQVKLRGLRIEIGDIEHCIGKIPGVLATAVVAVSGAGDENILVAYVQTEQDARIDTDLVASHLAAHLPDYMRPARVLLCSELPHNASGKIDKAALRTRGLPALEASNHRGPVTETERKLLAIWRGLLRVEEISVDASFLALGGHSLLAMRMIARIRDELGERITPDKIFTLLTIAKLAAHIDAQRAVLGVESAPSNADADGEIREF